MSEFETAGDLQSMRSFFFTTLIKLTLCRGKEFAAADDSRQISLGT